MIVRASLHSTGLTSGERSTHSNFLSKTCLESKEQEFELLGGCWGKCTNVDISSILLVIDIFAVYILGSNSLFDLKENIYCVQDCMNEAHQVMINANVTVRRKDRHGDIALIYM